MTFVKVKETDFVRDVNSMGLSNTNQNAKEEYYSKVRMVSAQKQQINNLKTEIDSIKNDVSEIKSMLCQLMEKK